LRPSCLLFVSATAPINSVVAGDMEWDKPIQSPDSGQLGLKRREEAWKIISQWRGLAPGIRNLVLNPLFRRGFTCAKILQPQLVIGSVSRYQTIGVISAMCKESYEIWSKRRPCLLQPKHSGSWARMKSEGVDQSNWIWGVWDWEENLIKGRGNKRQSDKWRRKNWSWNREWKLRCRVRGSEERNGERQTGGNEIGKARRKQKQTKRGYRKIEREWKRNGGKGRGIERRMEIERERKKGITWSGWHNDGGGKGTRKTSRKR